MCKVPGIMPGEWQSLNKCWFFEIFCQAVAKAAALGIAGL